MATGLRVLEPLHCYSEVTPLTGGVTGHSARTLGRGTVVAVVGAKLFSPLRGWGMAGNRRQQLRSTPCGVGACKVESEANLTSLERTGADLVRRSGCSRRGRYGREWKRVAEPYRSTLGSCGSSWRSPGGSNHQSDRDRGHEGRGDDHQVVERGTPGAEARSRAIGRPQPLRELCEQLAEPERKRPTVSRDAAAQVAWRQKRSAQPSADSAPSGAVRAAGGQGDGVFGCGG